MNKKSTTASVKSVGYVWVSKANLWQVYQHFNSNVADKIEWFNTEEEARNRVAEITAPKTQ